MYLIVVVMERKVYLIVFYWNGKWVYLIVVVMERKVYLIVFHWNGKWVYLIVFVMARKVAVFGCALVERKMADCVCNGTESKAIFDCATWNGKCCSRTACSHINAFSDIIGLGDLP